MKPNIKLWSILFFIFFEFANYSVAQVTEKLQTFIVAGDSTNRCFALYQRNYRKLHFVKSGAKYFAEATVSFEVYDSLKNLYRDEIKRRVFVDDYKSTKDDTKFISFLFKYNLPAGNYILKSALLLNGEPEFAGIKDKHISIEQDSVLNGSFLFLLNGEKDGMLKISSFGEFLSFRDRTLYPVYISDEKLSSLKIISKQFGKKKAYSLGRELNADDFNLSIQNDSLFLKLKKGKRHTHIYLFDDVLSKLFPGSAELLLQEDGKSKSYRITVIWENKPRILNDWDKTLEALSFIFPEKELSELNSADKNMKIKSLFDLWRQFDDNPATAYNPLMNEFFRRVDYSESHFTVSKRIDGYKTAMGKVYIRYGKPTSIERRFNTLNLPVEIWKYGNRSYIFVDKNQNGKYELMEIK